MKVMIHTYPSRLWYVENYIVPDLKSQGDPDIEILNDDIGKGNLFATMESFRDMTDKGNTWHIQDDVLVSDTFIERANSISDDYPVVCGFCSEYDSVYAKEVKADNMWYSFPCIRIDNKIAKECAEWFYLDASKMDKYKSYVKWNKFDDTFFKDFIQMRYRDCVLWNEAPNLVEHVDYLIGGSIANPQRDNVITSRYWIEYDKVEELRLQLSHENI